MQSAEVRSQGSSVRETRGLGFNLCVVPLPKNKGVLDLKQAEETEGGLYFTKVNYNLEQLLSYRAQSNMVNGVVWRMYCGVMGDKMLT